MRLVLDWKTDALSSNSLGNTVSYALATEYIREVLKQDVYAIPTSWYKDLWKYILPEDRIISSTNSDDDVRVYKSDKLDRFKDPPMGWVHRGIRTVGFEITDYEKINPVVCWGHSPDSKNVLIYPREHCNNNFLFTLDYWTNVCIKLIEQGYSIIAILNTHLSHRDGKMSVDWCNNLRKKIEFKEILSPTINNIIYGSSLCRLAIATMLGPSWLLMKSSIKQIILGNPNEPVWESSAAFNLSFFTKKVTLIEGTHLEWIRITEL